MSFCPHSHRFLRSRLHSGQLSCFPRQRVCFEYWSRQRGRIQAARCYAHNASHSNLTAPDDVLDELRMAYGPYRTEDTKSAARLARADSNTPRSGHNEQAVSVSSWSRKVDSALPDFTATVDGSEPEGHKVIYFHKKDGEVVRRSTRFISPGLMERDLDIRRKSLFNGPEDLNRWRAVRDELYRAKFQSRDIQEEIVNLHLSEEDQLLLEKLKTDSSARFSEIWEGLTRSEKASHWHRLSLWLLRHSPELLPQFLLTTCQSAEKPVFLMVSDCILFLDAFYPETLKDQTIIKACLDPETWPVLFLPQKGVRLYLKTVDRDHVYRAFEVARRKRIHLKPETCLCFMGRFIEFQDVDKAIEMLGLVQTLDQSEFSLDSQPVLRHCCKLLMLDSVGDHRGERNFRILPRLLEMGVRPNREMLNIVLSNSLKTSDPQVGSDVLNYMKNQDIDPDSYTYVTLLTDALARGDRARFESLLQEIQAQEQIQKNPWILSKILHYHFVFTAKNIDPDEDPKAVFSAMLEIYNTVHDITPLKELSIVPHQYTPPQRSDRTPPSVVALYIMIATYLRCQRQISNTKVIYSRFRSLVQQGHEIIAPLAATDHLYNEFLVSFRDDPRGLRPAVHLVEDMIQSSSNEEPHENPTGQAFIHTKPTMRTWTLLMSAFVYNNQSLAAEKVRMMMAKHGVKYNQVTWNTIISNFTNTQNIPEVAKAIKDMESQGFVIDDYTLKSLRYLRDPERLWVAIEELDRLSEPEMETSSSPDRLQKKDGELLDQGLQRLKENMKLKL